MEGKRKTENLFVYGTLRTPATLKRACRRAVPGAASVLRGYRKKYISVCGEPYPIIVPALARSVRGLLLEITPKELTRIDDWEDALYTRKRVRLTSGAQAWAYIPAA